MCYHVDFKLCYYISGFSWTLPFLRLHPLSRCIFQITGNVQDFCRADTAAQKEPWLVHPLQLQLPDPTYSSPTSSPGNQVPQGDADWQLLLLSWTCTSPLTTVIGSNITLHLQGVPLPQVPSSSSLHHPQQCPLCGNLKYGNPNF